MREAEQRLANHEIQYIGEQPGTFYLPEGTGVVERIIAGVPMSPWERQTYPTGQEWGWSTGSIGFLNFREINSQETGDTYLELELIGIEPQFRRKGYAKKLIRGVERIAQERGITRLILDDIRIDKRGMILLAEKLGYREKLEESELPWREVRKRHPNWIKSLVFEKILVD